MAIKTCIFSLSFVLCIFLISPACAASGPSIGLTTVPGAFNSSGDPLKICYTLNDIGQADLNLLIIR